MWIVAGPNGSGKTTLTRAGYLQGVLGPSAEAINPDDITAELRAREPELPPEAANLRAAEDADGRVDAAISENRSFLIETVLSSDKLKARVERAMGCGFRIGLTFVVLETPGLSVQRVRQRVAQAGHPVPEVKIRTRWPRSVANLSWFAERADVAHVIDNSEIGRPVLVAEKDETGWTWHWPGRIPEVDAALGGPQTPAKRGIDRRST